MNLDTQHWAVIDARANKGLWTTLAPGAGFLAAEVLQQRDDQVSFSWKDEDDNPLPESPQLIIIHTDCHQIANPPSATSGLEWAMRLREEPDRFRCPIVLVSFQRSAECTNSHASDGYEGSPLCASLTGKSQFHWQRLPQSPQDILNLGQTAIEAATVGSLTDEDWRSIARKSCKNQIERVHRRYKHGRGSFTAAFWLMSGAVQAGAISADQALKLVDKVEKNLPTSEEAYDFNRFRRYLSVLPTPGLPEPVVQRRNGDRRLLLVEDEYGWEETLHAVLGPSWHIQRSKSFGELPRDLDTFNLVLVDENLGDESGLSVIAGIRKLNPFIPVVLFTSNRDPQCSAEALEHCGATDVFLKQSSDTEWRESVEYYKTFAALISEYEDVQAAEIAQLRRGWELVKMLHAGAGPGGATADQLSNVRRTIESFQQAISLGAIAAGAAGQIVSASSIARAAMLQLEEALRSASEVCGVDRNARTREMIFAALPKEKHRDLLIRPKWVDKFLQQANEARHGGGIQAISACHAYWTGCANLIGQMWLGRTMAPQEKPSIELQPRLQRDRSTATHDLRSREGALRFLLGYGISRGMTCDRALEMWRTRNPEATGTYVNEVAQEIKRISSSRRTQPARRPVLLLVDDSADCDGWRVALETALEPIGYTVNLLAVSVEQLEVRLKEIRQEEATLLLDLTLPLTSGARPSEENGYSCLNNVRHRCPDLPVILFSATDNAYWARRCLRPNPTEQNAASAQGYFSKNGAQLPVGDELETGEFFQGYFEELCQLLEVAGPFTSIATAMRMLDSLLERQWFTFLDEVRDEKWRSKFAQSLADHLGTEAKGRLSEIIHNYVVQELTLIKTLAWIAENPSYRLLIERAWPSSSGSSSVLNIVPAGFVERLAQLVIAVAWGEWPSCREWGEIDHYFQHNVDFFPSEVRRRFPSVNHAGFEDAREQVWSFRKQRYRISSVSLEVTPICLLVGSLLLELSEAANKVCGGAVRGGEHKPPVASRPETLITTPRVGMQIQGVVTSVKHEWAYVDIGWQSDGLLHAGKMRATSVRGMLKINQRIAVRVTSFVPETLEVYLSPA